MPLIGALCQRPLLLFVHHDGLFRLLLVIMVITDSYTFSLLDLPPSGSYEI